MNSRQALIVCLIFCFYLIPQSDLLGSEKIVIKGKVIDAETNDQIFNAHIIYKRDYLGTTTDDQGKFIIYLQNASRSDTVMISHIGYESYLCTIEDILESEEILLKPLSISLEEITIQSSKFDIKEFMFEVIKNYEDSRLTEPHIAIAHYREKAKSNTKYIMMMESIGYTIYSGELANASPLSNYNFYCNNSRFCNTNPEWLALKATGLIPPACGSNLKIFRYLEERGVLALEWVTKYNFRIDSTYKINGQEIFRVHFRNRKNTGYVDVSANDQRLISLGLNTSDFWSTVFHDRVPAQIKINFAYFHDMPFLSNIKSQYSHKEIEHSNELNILVQKFTKFKFSSDEYWSMNIYNQNPYIQYSMEEWTSFGIDEDADAKRIQKDLAVNCKTNSNFPNRNTGNWFSLENYEAHKSQLDLVKIKLESLRKYF